MSVFIISVAAVLYAVVHSLLASLGAKARAKMVFGTRADRWYRLGYNLFAGISFLPIVALMIILPDQHLYTIPMPWILLTGLGQFAGVIIIVVGIWQTDAWHFIGLRQIFRTANPSQTQELNIDGLYGWVRHPLYTGGLIFIWLSPRMTVNLLTLFIILTLYLVVGAKLEEKRLIHEFGSAYRAYQQKVPMLVPRFRRK